jgi:TRAP-type C4-dicarboxylate transport system substrate-binding protein
MRIGSLLTAFILGAVLSSAASAQEFKLRFATSVANTQEPSYKEMEAFAQRVKQRSGGRLDLQLFPGEQLGAQKKVNEMISSGANIMNMTDYGQMGQFLPDAGVLAGPYIFGDLDQANRLFKSAVFKDVSDRLEQKGVKIIMANGLFGARHMLADRPIRKPDDLKGVTMRVPPSPIMVETFKAFGARPRRLRGARFTMRFSQTSRMARKLRSDQFGGLSSTRLGRWCRRQTTSSCSLLGSQAQTSSSRFRPTSRPS